MGEDLRRPRPVQGERDGGGEEAGSESEEGVPRSASSEPLHSHIGTLKGAISTRMSMPYRLDRVRKSIAAGPK